MGFYKMNLKARKSEYIFVFSCFCFCRVLKLERKIQDKTQTGRDEFEMYIKDCSK